VFYSAGSIFNTYAFGDYSAEASGNGAPGPIGQGTDRGLETGGEGFTYIIYVQPVVEMPPDGTLV